MKNLLSRRAVPLLLTLGFVGAHPATPRTPVFTFVAMDFAYKGPQELPAGIVELRMVNQGRQRHQIVVTLMRDTLTLSGSYKMIKANLTTDLAVDLGGPGGVEPGDTASAILRLSPGRYMISCWFETRDGVPHFFSGMMGEFTVRQPAGESSPPPKADAAIRASDYKFSLTGRWSAGEHVVEFANDGPQEHDLEIVALAPGKTKADLLAWLGAHMNGAAPGRLVGGAGGMMPGSTMWLRLHLATGRYAVFCFVPDVKDARPHFQHGMIQEFTVK